MLCLLFLILVAAATPAPAGDLEAAVQDYYGALLTDKVLSWEMEFKRCPELPSGNCRIVGMRGENELSIPRGTRLCWVDVQNEGKTKSMPVTVKITTVEEIPLARIDIPPRTVLTDSLIEWRVMTSTDLGSTSFPARTDVKSLWSRVRIPSGNILTMPRLEPVPAVAMGDEVTLISRSGSVEVKTTGQALEDGYMGDIIKVKSEFNNRKLKGLIEAGRRVVVQ